MQAHCLAGHSYGAGDVPEVAQLIDVLGSPVFPVLLLRATFAWAEPDHLTAFIFEPALCPHMIFAENTGTVKVAENVAEQYCRNYWQHDPAYAALQNIVVDKSQGSWMLQSSASEISHSEYRRHCYTAVSLEDRVSLSDTSNGQVLRINFYRRKGHPFTEDAIHRIASRAPLLLALVRRHANYSSVSRRRSVAYYRERLALTAPELTRREADVCAAIMLGLTSEGIALELGVGLNTVLTYKKRAYARLKISSQNQLMRLVLN